MLSRGYNPHVTATINNKTILIKSMHKWFMLVRGCLVLTLC